MVRQCARAFLRCPFLDDDELVPSKPEDIPHTGRGLVKRLAGALQSFTSGCVTELAVHAFEMIDVDEHQGHVAFASSRCRYCSRQPAVELSHVTQTRKRIVGGQAFLSSQRRSLDQ
jgi:hypothetical protein